MKNHYYNLCQDMINKNRKILENKDISFLYALEKFIKEDFKD